ncbi:MAG: bifunctional diaminohydroxyphosphoribosylaminopyrimidine deaminase/5-amino-6-(5-phosphoribosylamino)uracil reductase RibD [Chthoniobacterales bacterium]
MPASRDADFMREALTEARRALGRTSPNPAVGAIIVRNDRIIARGHHRAAGQPHAEIEALNLLPPRARTSDATLYVTLEPCSTHGRTPPCCEAIIHRRFSRVIYGATDPNPAHRGRARRLLTAAGIDVTTGVLRAECTDLNRFWNHWIQTGRPYVIAKCGQSLDGRISSHPESRWITDSDSRADAMQLRAQVDAVLVGAQTVRDDDPSLTVRGIKGARQPLRLVRSRTKKLPPSSKILTDRHRAKTEIVSGPFDDIFTHLGSRNVTSLLVEGGGETLGELFDQNLVDEIHFYTSPTLIGGPIPSVAGRGVADPSDAPKLKNVTYTQIGNDLKTTARF